MSINPVALRKGDVLAARMHRSFPVQEPVYTVGTETPGETKSVGFLYVFDILTDPDIKDVFGNKRTGYLAFQVVPRGTATNTKRIFQIPAEYNASLGIKSYGYDEWDIVLDPAIEMPLLKNPAIPSSFDVKKLDKRGGPSEEVHRKLIAHIQATFGERNLFVKSFYFPKDRERPINQPTIEEATEDIAKIFEAQVPDTDPEDPQEKPEEIAKHVANKIETADVADDVPTVEDTPIVTKPVPADIVDKTEEPIKPIPPVQEEFKRVSYDISLHLIMQRRTIDRRKNFLRPIEASAFEDIRGGANHNDLISKPLISTSGEVIHKEGIQTLQEAWQFVQGLSDDGNETEIINELRKKVGLTPDQATAFYAAVTWLHDLLDDLPDDVEVDDPYLESLVTNEELVKRGANNGGVSIIAPKSQLG